MHGVSDLPRDLLLPKIQLRDLILNELGPRTSKVTRLHVLSVSFVLREVEAVVDVCLGGVASPCCFPKILHVLAQLRALRVFGIGVGTRLGSQTRLREGH